jgi:hypothetical protein
LLFHNELVRALSSLDESWEAGEKPALPRNCKRGNLPLPTGQESGKSGGGIRSKLISLASQETGANRNHTPFA